MCSFLSTYLYCNQYLCIVRPHGTIKMFTKIIINFANYKFDTNSPILKYQMLLQISHHRISYKCMFSMKMATFTKILQM